MKRTECKRSSNRNCKGIIIALTAVLLIAVSGGVGFLLGNGNQKSAGTEEILQGKQDTKESTRIAVVNLDEGIVQAEEKISYSDSVIQLPGDSFEYTSLNEARMGLDNGIYGAYIMIPATFSQSVASINTTPQTAQLEYVMDKGLSGETQCKLLSDIMKFGEDINNSLSYMYVDNIMEEFHQAQDGVTTVLNNDLKDKEAIDSVNLQNFVQMTAMPDLTNPDYDIQTVDINEYVSANTELVKEIDAEYQKRIDEMEEAVQELQESGENLLESLGMGTAGLQQEVRFKFDDTVVSEQDTDSQKVIENISEGMPLLSITTDAHTGKYILKLDEGNENAPKIELEIVREANDISENRMLLNAILSEINGAEKTKSLDEVYKKCDEDKNILSLLKKMGYETSEAFMQAVADGNIPLDTDVTLEMTGDIELFNQYLADYVKKTSTDCEQSLEQFGNRNTLKGAENRMDSDDEADERNGNETGDESESGNEGESGDEGEGGDEGETGDEGEGGDEGETGDEGEGGDEGETGDEGEGGTGDEGEGGDEGEAGDEGESGDGNGNSSNAGSNTSNTASSSASDSASNAAYEKALEEIAKYNQQLAKISFQDTTNFLKKSIEAMEKNNDMLQENLSNNTQSYTEYVDSVYRASAENTQALQRNVEETKDAMDEAVKAELNDAKGIKNATSYQNQQLLSEFAVKLPYTRLGSLEYTQAYEFIAQPSYLTDGSAAVIPEAEVPKTYQKQSKANDYVVYGIFAIVIFGLILFLGSRMRAAHTSVQ